MNLGPSRSTRLGLYEEKLLYLQEYAHSEEPGFRIPDGMSITVCGLKWSIVFKDFSRATRDEALAGEEPVFFRMFLSAEESVGEVQALLSVNWQRLFGEKVGHSSESSLVFRAAPSDITPLHFCMELLQTTTVHSSTSSTIVCFPKQAPSSVHAPFLTAIASARHSGTDCTLKIVEDRENRTISAHKFILSTYSDYFRRGLGSQFAESVTGEFNCAFPFEIMNSVIDFLYSTTLSFEGCGDSDAQLSTYSPTEIDPIEERIGVLFTIADYYGIPVLHEELVRISTIRNMPKKVHHYEAMCRADEEEFERRARVQQEEEQGWIWPDCM